MGYFFSEEKLEEIETEEMGEISRTNTYQTQERVIRGNVG